MGTLLYSDLVALGSALNNQLAKSPIAQWEINSSAFKGIMKAIKHLSGRQHRRHMIRRQGGKH